MMYGIIGALVAVAMIFAWLPVFAVRKPKSDKVIVGVVQLQRLYCSVCGAQLEDGEHIAYRARGDGQVWHARHKTPEASS